MKLKQRLVLGALCGIVFFVIKPLIELDDPEWQPRHRRHHRLVHRVDYDSLAGRESQGFENSRLHGPGFQEHKEAIRQYHLEMDTEDLLVKRNENIVQPVPVLPVIPVQPKVEVIEVPLPNEIPVINEVPIVKEVPHVEEIPPIYEVPLKIEPPSVQAPPPKVPRPDGEFNFDLEKYTPIPEVPKYPSLKIESNVDPDIVESEIKRLILNSDQPAAKTNAWEVAKNWIRPRLIYPQNHPQLGWILNQVTTVKIKKADILPKGTQLKMLIYLEGNQKAVFKPMRYARDYVVPGSAWSGYDRHNAEIAAFHLDRVLNFRRAPLVTSRKINFKEELLPVAAERLSNTFKEVDGKQCFYGICYYCNENEYACAGDDGLLEGSVTIWFPEDRKLEKIRHPYQRTYKDDKKAKWETEENFCNSYVKKTEPYNKGNRLLDIMDTTIFDFLIGNGDRHHYEVFKDTPDAMLLLMDNAKSFGNATLDDMSILAPLRQCCLLRQSTFDRLVFLRNGLLTKLLTEAMKNDPIAPVLHKSHIEAINRRMPIIFQHIQTCVNKFGKESVITEVWKGLD